MKRLFHVYLLIFRELIIYTQLFTLLAAVIFVRVGWNGLPYIFWTKVVGWLSVAGLFWFSRRQQIVFYHNLGLSSKALVFIVVGSDVLVLAATLTAFSCLA